LSKSKLAVLYRDVEAMEARLVEEEGIPVVGGGEMSAKSDIRRRGVYSSRAEGGSDLRAVRRHASGNVRGLCITESIRTT